MAYSQENKSISLLEIHPRNQPISYYLSRMIIKLNSPFLCRKTLIPSTTAEIYIPYQKRSKDSQLTYEYSFYISPWALEDIENMHPPDRVSLISPVLNVSEGRLEKAKVKLPEKL